ncbi:unnamed protein product, partial [Vitis vinifera]
MDLDNKSASFSHTCEFIKNDNFGDTTLSLNCFGFGGSNTARIVNTRNSLGVKPSNPPDDGCRLVLGLGPTPNTYCDDYYHVDVNKSKGSATMYPKRLPSEVDSILKLGPSGGVGEFLGLDFLIPVVDEGSTSAKKSGGYMPSLLLAPRMDRKVSMQTQELFELGTKSHHHLSQLTTAVTSSDHRNNNPKKCKFMDCTKGARGASGLCIGHGGGQRCQKPGCNKGAESRTAYCKAHGGGRRCQQLGCTKSAEGKTNFCIAHGGGRRCSVPGCTKSARGRTDCCVKHGGGKRCKFENCGKSAQGSTDFCKAHGGGKRCSWGEGKCEKFARGKSGLCAAHSSLVQERETKKGGMIGPGLFHGLVPTATSTGGSSFDNNSSSGVSVISDCINSLEKASKRRQQQLIPPQVLVPLSMKSSSSYSSSNNTAGGKSFNMMMMMIPEGRVHGGGLMSMLGGNLKNACNEV